VPADVAATAIEDNITAAHGQSLYWDHGSSGMISQAVLVMADAGRIRESNLNIGCLNGFGLELSHLKHVGV